jgi:hypothetical protein
MLVLVSCATISGLSDKEAVDCPSDCDGGLPPPRSDGSIDGSEVVDTGPPKCDPATNAECMPLPAGWSFVARAGATAESRPQCPSGTTGATVVREAPTARPDACTCETCTVTTPATCSGQLTYRFSTTTVTCSNDGDPNHYKNPVAGNCYQDLYTAGEWIAEQNRFDLPAPSGGVCSVTPTPRVDRVSFGATSTICADATRCSGGVCDARVDAPFAACVARSGIEECPAGFSDRHVVGSEGAELDCGACPCTLNRAPCQGAVHLYTDAACTAGQVIVPANGTCGGPETDNNRFDSYKVVATSTTTCNTGGTTAATNARMKNPRTVCCRD